MNSIFILAMKEIRAGIRNRWVFSATLLLAGLALTLGFVGSAPSGTVGASSLEVITVSLSSLTIFLVPLIALLLSHDAIVGETERGTMLLLLSYPLARWQVILGKFVGHVGILAFATFTGYGAAALAIVMTGAAPAISNWGAFISMLITSLLLGASFVAIGYLASALVSARGTAAGIAMGTWVIFVIIYDMALLGLLVADKGQTLTAGAVDVFLILNPADSYRLLNLGYGPVAAVSGMAGMVEQSALTPAVLLVTLMAWVVLPLAGAVIAFSRREL